MASIHYLSLCSLRLSVFNSIGTQVDLASGFFYENANGDLFIVTNWHVVTGRQPQRPQVSSTGAVPTKLSFSVCRRQESREGSAVRLRDLLEFEVDLNSEDGNSPKWLEHPELKYRVDVVAIPVSNREELETVGVFHSVSTYPSLEPRYSPSVMDSVVVIGFPWGLSAGGPLPIFKRGSVASDPIVPQGGLPRFLIDCRTTSSMSGSPIIASHSGIWDPNGGTGLSLDGVIGTVENFIGVYAGRLTGVDLGDQGIAEITELGIAWRKDAVDQIVNAGVTGTALDRLMAIEGTEPE